VVRTPLVTGSTQTPAWNRLGNLLSECAGREDEAEAAYREAIAAAIPDARLGLGSLLSRQQGRAEEAEAVYREAIDTGDDRAWHGLGCVRHGQPGREAETGGGFSSGDRYRRGRLRCARGGGDARRAPR
jgi:tetratricopeptide (TPR) repeat protein